MQNRSASRLLFIVLYVVCSSIPGLARRQERLIDTWKPIHYDISLTLNTSLTEISSARADIQVSALKELSLIDLDFGNLTVDSVSLNDAPVPFVRRNEKLEISLPSRLPANTTTRVTVTYHGKPSDGLVLKLDRDGRPSAIGDNWPNRVHHWIPSFDHPSAKATVTFKVTAPGKNLVIANGRFQSVETVAEGTRTWTYTEGVPIPPYCMVIGVGDFAKINPSQPTITPLSYYVSSSDSAYALKGFSPAAPALRMFSETVGPYPYEKLDLIIGATQFGGMENSSAIVFTPKLFVDLDGKRSRAFGVPEGIETVIAHEIAHQWFGDSVTGATWADFWLSEGFATYFAGLFIERHDGQQAFQSYMEKAADAVFKYSKKAQTPIHDRDTEELFGLLNANSYQKGAWVLHMLRSRLGDEIFLRGVRNYYQAHKNSTATTDDFRTALERASGKKLGEFFDRWVYEADHPQYEVKWRWLSKSRSVSVTLTQVQNAKLFADPVPVVIKTSAGEIREIITPSGRTASITVHSAKKPTSVEVDPDDILLNEIVR
jgi:aminopeptidase N